MVCCFFYSCRKRQKYFYRDSKYYKIKAPNFKGVRGRWEANNPNYIDGASDNFKAFTAAKSAGKSDVDAAFPAGI